MNSIRNTVIVDPIIRLEPITTVNEETVEEIQQAPNNSIVETTGSTQRKKLSERAVTTSKTIDTVVAIVGTVGCVTLNILTQVFAEDSKALKIVGYVSASLNALLLVCPVKSKYLDALKK